MAQADSKFYLSPDQQNLLMAALSSNTTSSSPLAASNGNSSVQPDRLRNGSHGSSNGDADQNGFSSGNLEYDDSPYLDFNADADFDENYDFEGNDQMIGDMPGTSELHDKRKSIEGAEEDEEGGGKRRESETATAKKPGRKPLTSEPTTKRKAQNRAAQRAFRERKEQHLKDLETKVDTLEKAAESANHENGLLKAQLERQQVELKEYRKRLSWVSQNPLNRNGSAGSKPAATQQGAGNDFSFEFPKFGDLPANHIFNNGSGPKAAETNPARSSTLPSKPIWTSKPSTQKPSTQIINGSSQGRSFSSSSPVAQPPAYGSTGNSPVNHNLSASPVSQLYAQSQKNGSIDSLSGLFSPSILEASRNTQFDYFPQSNGQALNSQAYRSGANQTGASTLGTSVSNTDSPSSSSDSHQATSSMGTSPEPSLSSPSNKFNTSFDLNTISEEQNQLPSTFASKTTFCDELAKACGNSANPIPAMYAGANTAPDSSINHSSYDPSNFNYLAQQNGGGFDPVLFGDYRESQNSVVSQDFGSFFNDAFPLPDLGSPLHNFNEVAPSPAPQAQPKSDLMKQVDAAQQGEPVEEVVRDEDKGKLMTCNKIWDRLQSMEKFRNGEIDVDNLCAELRSKARCSEGGAVVAEKEVDRILSGAK